MASPSSIWSAQLDPISTWPLTKGQADLALFLFITSSYSKKSQKTKSRKLRSYYRHCCSAPRGFVRGSAIGPQELREVQGLPLPPTSFLPCRVRLSGGRRETCFLLLGAEKSMFCIREEETHLSRPFGSSGVCAQGPGARQGRPSSSSENLVSYLFILSICQPQPPSRLLQQD